MVAPLQEGEIVKLVVARRSARGLHLAAPDQGEIYMSSGEVKGEPAVAEAIWVGLYSTNGKLSATMKLDKVALRYQQPVAELKTGDMVTGLVYNLTEAGAFLRTKEHYLGHIPVHELVGSPKIGQKVEARITKVRPDGRLNLSMRPLKEISRVSDAELILEKLQQQGGVMPFTDETPPEVLQAQFGISKRAFKRAMGKLLKDGRVEQQAGETRLT